MKKYNSKNIYMGKIYHTLYDCYGYACQENDMYKVIAFELAIKPKEHSFDFVSKDKKIYLAKDILNEKLYPIGNTKSYYSALSIKKYCDMSYVVKPYTSLASILDTNKITKKQIEDVVAKETFEVRKNRVSQICDYESIKSFKTLMIELFKIIINSSFKSETPKNLLDYLVILNNRYEEELIINIQSANTLSSYNVESEYVKMINDLKCKIINCEIDTRTLQKSGGR